MGEEDIGKNPKKFPWFEPFACEGCGDCIPACPTGSIELLDKEGQKIPKAWVTNPDTCIGCGKCAKACIVGAVQMTSYVNMAKKRYKEEPRPV
ncbi:MAG: 4Fe-4S dicluster domain-containing protein [Methanobacteriota archaeon]